MKLGDWFRVVQLVKWGGGGGKKKTLRMLCEIMLLLLLCKDSVFPFFFPVQFYQSLFSSISLLQDKTRAI